MYIYIYIYIYVYIYIYIYTHNNYKHTRILSPNRSSIVQGAIAFMRSTRSSARAHYESTAGKTLLHGFNKLLSLLVLVLVLV